MDAHEELKDRIRSLKEIREQHETLIIRDLSNLHAIIKHPAPFLKNVAKDLAADKDFKTDLLNIALNLGTNYLSKILTRRESGSSLLSAIYDKLVSKNEATDQGSIVNMLMKFFSKSGTKRQSN